MKSIFTLIALGSVALISADQYNRTYGNGYGPYTACNNYGGYYQDPYDNGNYYQPNQRQNSYGYSQRNNSYDNQGYRGQYNHYPQQQWSGNQFDYQQNWQRNQYDSYQQQSNNPYDQRWSGNQQYEQNQNQQYYQQQQGDLSYNNNVNTPNNYGNSYGYQNNNVSDQELHKKIQDALSSGWFSKGYKHVSFDVNNGNVNLRGSVDTLENKNKVEESIRKIDGVRQVNNQLTIAKEHPNEYSDSDLQNLEKKFPQDVAFSAQDRQLNAKIRDKLSNGWFMTSYETIVIRTNNGAVVISGTVDKPEDVQKIIDQIKEIEGVKSVNTQLTVKNKNK